MNFHLIDWLILIVYLTGTVYVGLRARKYVENMEGYYVAGRKVKVALGSATLIATEIGVVTFMYFAQLGFLTGFSCFILGVIGFFGYMVIGKTGFIVSGLRRLKVITIPEFYELRYNKSVRWLGGVLLFLGGVLNMGIFLRFDGIFLSEAIGLGEQAKAIVMVIMLIIVISYTVLGGMFSVVITDFIQFVILTFGMFISTVFVLAKVNFHTIASTVVQQYGTSGLNPITNPQFGWTFLIWMLIGSIAISALNQPAVSKSFASESPEVGRKVFLYAGLTLGGRYMIPMLWGVAALAVFGSHINSLVAMPRLLGSAVPSGLLGLMVAGMLAASMSTYSAYLLAWSTVATRDVVAPLLKSRLSDDQNVTMTRIIAALIGIFMLVFGLFYKIPSTAFQYLAITGAMYAAGAFACVVAGLYWKRANVIGAYSGLALGAAAPVSFLLLSLFKESLPKSLLFLVDVNVSGLLSFVLAGAGMVIGSLATQRSHPPVIISEPSHGEKLEGGLHVSR
ncbi:MAG: sodium:solute symporter family protein [Bacteroidetes bacterium]|nr:sodium:solute symporter family protein [Bacteroidota bacterium]